MPASQAPCTEPAWPLQTAKGTCQKCEKPCALKLGTYSVVATQRRPAVDRWDVWADPPTNRYPNSS